MSITPVILSSITIAVTAIVACAAGGVHRPRIVELHGPGSVRAMNVAGRTVRDLAAADRLLVGVRGGSRAVTTAAGSIRTANAAVERSLCGGRILVVRLPAGTDILSAARKFQGKPGIEFAEPDRVAYLTKVPTDPEYSNQPHLPKIVCPDGWDIETGSEDVVIAVIDSGIDTDHPDLQDCIWTNGGEIPGNGIDDDGNGYVDDVHGWNFYDGNNNIEAIPNGQDENSDGKADEQVNHGTLTAGIAAARANGVGTVGVAWRATIMPIKVFPDDGTTFVSTVIEGMEYAEENGADIVNLSIGAPYEHSFTPPIVDLWNRGGITVSAGGNSGREITESQSTWTSPTCNNGPDPVTDNMNIAVGGLTLRDQKASWSNYDGSAAQNFVDVFAPGVNIYGPGVYYPSVTGFDSYYTSNSGTSFSAPMISGLAALLMAQDPSRTGADVLQIITNTCDDIDWRNPGYAGKLGAGRINVARALGAELPASAPTNVRAFDTPSDQGGSITVTWTKSPDDGGGSNSVTGYVVSRAEGALPHSADTSGDASWSDVGSVAAGVTMYIDDTTVDGVEYFYRVAAISLEGRSESDPAGPVFSYDDSAPPRVENLLAYDRPVDNGGAIELDWTRYTGSSDIAEFRIFRSQRPFNSILGMAPIVTIGDPGARSYTDTTTIDGRDYYYAVVAVDDENNQREDVVVAGPVQSFVNGAVSFSSGLYMMGAPVVPEDRHPATLFSIARSALNYARYNTAADSYETYLGDPISDLLKLQLGKGFWIRFENNVSFVPQGAVAPAGNYTVNTQPGWCQLGNPFLGTVDFSASTVTVNNNTMDLDSADTLGVMRSYAWTYSRVTSGYDLLHPMLGSGTDLEPWEGFWVKVQQSCAVTLMRPTGGVSTGVEGRALDPGSTHWPVQIIARGDNSVDAANYFGVSDSVSNIEAPPQANGGVELCFTSTPAAPATARYAAAFEHSERAHMEWPFMVEWSNPQGGIALSWPDLSDVPHDYSLMLEDKETNCRLSMRHQTGYEVGADSPTGVRHFTIEASRTADRSLQITAFTAHATSAGAEVVFSLSAPAVCDVSVMNIAGRCIGTVQRGRMCSAGANTAVWNARSDTGTRVPPGQYLVRITARGDDGTATSALRSLRIRHYNR